MRAASRAVPSAQAPPVPVSLMHPSVPASWVRVPVAVSREKTATASLISAATYKPEPSGLIDTDLALSSAFPSRHAPPFPVSLTHPFLPARLREDTRTLIAGKGGNRIAPHRRHVNMVALGADRDTARAAERPVVDAEASDTRLTHATRRARQLGQSPGGRTATEDRDRTARLGRDVDVLAFGAHDDRTRPVERDAVGAYAAGARFAHTAGPAGELGERARRRIAGEDGDGVAEVRRDVDARAVGA